MTSPTLERGRVRDEGRGHLDGETTALEFELPGELEAHEPPEARGLARDEVRLLVSYASPVGSARGDRVVDATFRDLPWFLDPGDLVVVNDSETLAAALTAQREDGEEIDLHLSTRLAGRTWVVEPRKTRARAGEVLALPGGQRARLLAPYAGSERLWVAELSLDGSVRGYLGTMGRPISYPYVRGRWPLAAYQTVYARPRAEVGSAEMPSAGRAFSGRVLEALAERGVAVERVTLHTGVASLEAPEPPYDEWYEVPRETAEAVRAARARGARVVATGTTVVRALESAVDGSGEVRASAGWTDLVVTPERGVAAVDGLLTGFHEPRASHLQLLSAVAGVEHVRRVYAHALAQGYLWHEFGDLHLLLRGTGSGVVLDQRE